MPPPRGGGALYSHLNDVSHASSPHSQGGPQAAQNSANNTQNGANLTPQEQLLAGEDLGLDPENDPVVFTTDYGLDIRWHMAGEYTGGNKVILESGVKFAGYAYIT
ncbi:MAG: hypothetical protein IKK20_01965, partial [Clostridia bacterium]|nr:hypothetical protein [Clostridia bacterium]